MVRVRLIALVVSMCLLAGCGPKPMAKAPAKPSPASSPAKTSPAPKPASLASHVFVIVMENHSYGEVVNLPYISRLASQYAVATNYHSVSSPSLPNYLALTSGSTWGITDDGYHPLPAGGLGEQLTKAGIDWRAYMENMDNGCFNSPYPYALKHNPFAYYGTPCPPQVTSLANWTTDMAGTVPRFVWITPDMCHDGHDCSNAVADDWLSQMVPLIMDMSAWKDNGLLIITWDEGTGNDNQVLTMVIRPNSTPRQSNKPYDHYSLLATIEDQFGLARLGEAAQATPMNDLVASQAQLQRRLR
jgi:phospholipase C